MIKEIKKTLIKLTDKIIKDIGRFNEDKVFIEKEKYFDYKFSIYYYTRDLYHIDGVVLSVKEFEDIILNNLDKINFASITCSINYYFKDRTDFDYETFNILIINAIDLEQNEFTIENFYKNIDTERFKRNLDEYDYLGFDVEVMLIPNEYLDFLKKSKYKDKKISRLFISLSRSYEIRDVF